MWQLTGTKAQFASSRCTCTIDLSRSPFGLRNIRVAPDNDQLVLDDCRLLQLESGGGLPEDSYARGQDLFVSIGESEQAPFRTQIYWRAINEADHFGFEAILSVQTSRWHVSPELELSSRILGEHTAVDSRAMLVTLPSTEVSYLEIAHSSNHNATTIDCDCIKHHLFGGHLEKGVIRRARVRGLFLPTNQANQLTTSFQEQFERSPPPLTT
ncbi:MAG: hypothetical protein CMJ64_00785 [Planctomycetaceae bacterium]|nr:hypothetical protein [Planctomycetaceae bacterium]